MKKPLLLAFAALSLLVPRSPAVAQDLLSLGVGDMNVLDNEEMWDFRADYRWGDGLIWQIKPYVGVEFNDEGAMYGVGGLYYDFPMAPHWYLTPSIGAGLWHDGGGPDLGHAVEFRSQLDLAYEFSNGHRLAVGFSHISNASLGDHNPGTEILDLQWQVPVNWWGGN